MPVAGFPEAFDERRSVPGSQLSEGSAAASPGGPPLGLQGLRRPRSSGTKLGRGSALRALEPRTRTLAWRPIRASQTRRAGLVRCARRSARCRPPRSAERPNAGPASRSARRGPLTSRAQSGVERSAAVDARPDRRPNSLPDARAASLRSRAGAAAPDELASRAGRNLRLRATQRPCGSSPRRAGATERAAVIGAGEGT